MVDKKQCNGCDYCKGLYGGGVGVGSYCDYMGETGKRRPKPVDGICPVRKSRKKKRRNFNPLPGKEGEYIEIRTKGDLPTGDAGGAV